MTYRGNILFVIPFSDGKSVSTSEYNVDRRFPTKTQVRDISCHHHSNVLGQQLN